jgi:hypothetical protein
MQPPDSWFESPHLTSFDLGLTTLSRALVQLALNSRSLELGRSPYKEVIQPHLPVRLPCYDFTPVISPALGAPLRERLG